MAARSSRRQTGWLDRYNYRSRPSRNPIFSVFIFVFLILLLFDVWCFCLEFRGFIFVHFEPNHLVGLCLTFLALSVGTNAGTMHLRLDSSDGFDPFQWRWMICCCSPCRCNFPTFLWIKKTSSFWRKTNGLPPVLLTLGCVGLWAPSNS